MAALVGAHSHCFAMPISYAPCMESSGPPPKQTFTLLEPSKSMAGDSKHKNELY